MKKLIIISLALTVFKCLPFAQSVSIIPLPNYVVNKEGIFTINSKTTIEYSSQNDTIAKTASYLKAAISEQNGFTLEVKNFDAKSSNCIVFKIQAIDSLGKEGYILKVLPKQIEIIANAQAGLFYAVQSLIQLIPISNTPVKEIAVSCVEITDFPRFSYRGMMHDCSRHFFSTTFLKKLLDHLALHKINTFHWHLTDDQGWRIEIKQFPELTSVAAFRKGTMVESGLNKAHVFDNKRYGGFYTQTEIKEIVKYAADRFITVIPEIEMPGHARAAIAAYPWLGSTDTLTEVGTVWGVHPYLYNPFDTAFYFLEKVLSEVFELFPSEYVHIGGDEAVKTQWIANAKIQDKIRELGLKNENELQSWFIKRIQRFAQSKGKKIIGWDEITEGGAPKDAAIMYWRSDTKHPLEEAVKGNHPIVVTPNSYLYLSYPPSSDDNDTKPWSLSLKSVYTFEPIPAFCTKEQEKLIMGAQACVWTEFIATPELAEEMLNPRFAAMSEIVWTKKEKKNYNDFTLRLKNMYSIYNKRNIKYFKK